MPSITCSTALQQQQQQQQDNDNLYGYVVRRFTPFEEFVEVFSELICAAQECVRSLADGERSVTSLRDVSRCVQVFRWFGDHFSKNKDPKEKWTLEDFYNVHSKSHKMIRKAVVLSIAYCYYARLPRHGRQELVTSVTERWRRLQIQQYLGGFYGGGNPYRAQCRWLNLDPESFNKIVQEVQVQFTTHMNIGDGIALNEALCENLFMILISVLNQIPIFVIGKPGSSKSLAMGLVQSNLNGDASDNEFLRSFPGVEVFSYQCSPLSTSHGIEQAFESARRYRRDSPNTIVVVLLDEVGLAEQSPHLPLKVLHKVMDQSGPGESVVGISNWALDPAKMNRAVHLYRPAPTVEDLSMTAEGMVRSANLKGYLQALARAYDKVYRGQEHPDFWGLREFYSTVRAINTSLHRAHSDSGVVATALNPQILLNSVLRNFGGRPSESEKVIEVFFNQLGLTLSHDIVEQKAQKLTIEFLVRQNLAQPEARHLMLLTKNNAALGLLFDRKILDHEKTEIIFGSDFPLDQTDLQVCLNIQRVKLCMAEGITVVLVHCESLYESLYDLLNQHYCEYGGKLYVRLAFGTHSRLCPIHQNFRVIVVVEKIEAYTRLAPPLLNRFEKQVFERKDVLCDTDNPLFTRIRQFIKAFAATNLSFMSGSNDNEVTNEQDENDSSHQKLPIFKIRSAFCGYHGDLLGSLILAVRDYLKSNPESPLIMNQNIQSSLSTSDKVTDISSEQQTLQQAEQEQQTLFQLCVQQLLWITAPEATCRLMAANKGEVIKTMQQFYHIDITSIYFQHQRHSSLPAFIDYIATDPTWKIDEYGTSLIAMTYSPLVQDAANLLQERKKDNEPLFTSVSHIVLHELDQERDVRNLIGSFFENAVDGSLLLVQCDPLAASLRRIEHVKFICESMRAKFVHRVTTPTKSEAKNESDETKDTFDENVMQLDNPLDSTKTTKTTKTTENTNDTTNPYKRGIFVLLLLHLPRGAEVEYCVSFDMRWKFAFVDSVTPADISGLPDVEDMIGRTMKEVVSSLDLKKVLIKSFRSSLSRLVYMHQRTNNDVRNQIETLIKYLEEENFISCIRRLMGDILSQSETSFDVFSAAQEERALQLAGTFQGALHAQILETVAFLFTVILSHMDRNKGLALYNLDDPNSCSLWLKLFEKSFNDMNIYSIVSSQMTTHAHTQKQKSVHRKRSKDIEVISDGVNGASFLSKFPFSFFFMRIFDSMRSLAESAGEIALIQQFALLNIEPILAGVCSDEVMSNYVHDIVCMTFPRIETMDSLVQSDIVIRLLCLFSPDDKSTTTTTTVSHEHAQYNQSKNDDDDDEDKQNKDDDSMMDITMDDSKNNNEFTQPIIDISVLNDGKLHYLASVHARLWKIERNMNLIFLLLDMVPHAHEKFSKYVHEEISHVNDSTFMKMLELILESLLVSNQKWETTHDYTTWLSSILIIKSTILSLFDLLQGAQGWKQCKEIWEKLDFFLTFVRDIAQPLELEPPYTVQILNSFENMSLLTQSTFHQLLMSLTDLNQSILRQQRGLPDEFICPITLERMTNPVIAADGHSYEYSAIMDWFNRGFYTSPKTNLILSNTSVRPNHKLKERISMAMECDLPAFMEYYLFEILFSPDRSDDLDPNLASDLILFIAGKTQNLNIEERFLVGIVPSEAEKIGLLREILKVSEPRFHQIAQSCLVQQIKETVQLAQCLDTPLCIQFTTVAEELLDQIPDIEQIQVSLLRFGSLDLNSTDIIEVLRSVAKVRKFISHFANHLSTFLTQENNDNMNQTEIERVHETSRRISDLFSRLNDPDGSLQSIRMFLLRLLERKNGIFFVRSALQMSPLSETQWVQQWCESNDTSFLRFLGQNKLPKINPFKFLPYFQPITHGIGAFLVSGEIGNIEDSLTDIITNHGDNDTTRLQIKGTFLAVLYHQIYLLNVLSEDKITHITERLPVLCDWIEYSPISSNYFEPNERSLFLLFLGKSTRFSPMERIQLGLLLNSNSSTESILRLTVLVHIIAASLSASKKSPLSLLRNTMFSPEVLTGTLLPTMPEDVLAMANRVMGGRWYRCPNGHPFYVDLCGRPTVIQKCADCGVDIGGLNHNLLETNVDINSVGENLYQKTEIHDDSEINYCLRTAEEEEKDKFILTRNLQTLSIQILRLMFHGTLLIGAVSQDETWLSRVGPLFNRTYCNPENVPLFFSDHIQSNWKQLQVLMNRPADSISVLMHLLLLSISNHLEGVTLPPIPEDVQQPTMPEDGSFDRLINGQTRIAWEDTLNINHILRIFDSNEVEQHLEQATTIFHERDEAESSPFVVELLEKIDISTIQKEERIKKAPSLWRFYRPFDMSHFIVTLNSSDRSQQSYPVLYSFFENEQQLRTLRYLPEVFQWFSLLVKLFNRKLARDEARKMSVGDVFRQNQHNVEWCTQAAVAFEGFSVAWNQNWRNVKRFGCLRIPLEYQQIAMTFDTPITFSLPGDSDEGICPVALVRYMTDQHNNFVQIIDEYLLLSDRNRQRGEARQRVVSSRNFTHAHVINYDLENDFRSYLEKHCLVLSPRGGVEYDFMKAQTRLLSKYFSSVPAMDLEIRFFVYSHEQHLQGGVEPLRQKVLQVPIPHDLKEMIIRDLATPATAQILMETLETAVSFLVATGGSVVQQLGKKVADMLLIHYLKTVLVMENPPGMQGRVLNQQIKLKHLCALWEILNDFTTCDPFAPVSQIYKEPLTNEMETCLKQTASQLNLEILLNAMKPFISTQLREEHINQNEAVKETISWLEVGDNYLSDFDWFVHFPDQLQMRTIVDAFKLFNEIKEL